MQGKKGVNLDHIQDKVGAKYLKEGTGWIFSPNQRPYACNKKVNTETFYPVAILGVKITVFNKTNHSFVT